MVPVLAAEAPSLQNGQVAKDGVSVTWKLKKNVAWHDGQPFTADDVVFTWEYVMDPGTAAVTIGSYRDIVRIDKLDSHTVKIGFKSPTPSSRTGSRSRRLVTRKRWSRSGATRRCLRETVCSSRRASTTRG